MSRTKLHSSEYHFHFCEACRTTWAHRKKDFTRSIREEHCCPKCGGGPYHYAYASVRDALEFNRLDKVR